MAAQPSRYTELASYREQIQFANRIFRWSSVYMFDIHSRMAYAKQIQLGNSASLDVIGTTVTLYATVLDVSALRPHPRQCSRCKSFDHLAKDCTFLAQDQMEENSLQKSTGYGARTSVGNQNLSWKYTRWYSPQARKDAVFTSEKPATRVPTVSEPTSANLVGGTILRPIAHSLPRVQSPFPIDVWRDALRNHPDSDLVNDLLLCT